MNKTETKKLTDKIKGYYNSQFYVDEYVIDAWYETLKPYELNDAIEHIKTYIKEFPDIAPKPHTFIKGMLTPEEKKLAEKDYIIDCNLCGRTMLYSNFEEHHKKCLLCKALETKAKEMNKNLTYEDFMRIPYEKLNKGYGHLFKQKLSSKEILERIG